MSNSQRRDGDGHHAQPEIYGPGQSGNYSYDDTSVQHGGSHLTLPPIRSLDLALSHIQQLPTDPSQHLQYCESSHTELEAASRVPTPSRRESSSQSWRALHSTETAVPHDHDPASTVYRDPPSLSRSYPPETGPVGSYPRLTRQEGESEGFLGTSYSQRAQGQDVSEQHLDREGRPVDYRSYPQPDRSESPSSSTFPPYDASGDGSAQRYVSQEQFHHFTRYDQRMTPQTATSQPYPTTHVSSHLSYPYQPSNEILQGPHRDSASASYVTSAYQHLTTPSLQHHDHSSYRQQPSSSRARRTLSYGQTAPTLSAGADPFPNTDPKITPTSQSRTPSRDVPLSMPRAGIPGSEPGLPSRAHSEKDLQQNRPISTIPRYPPSDTPLPRIQASKSSRILLSNVAQLGSSIAEIIENCTALSTFARHYAALQREGRLRHDTAPSAAQYAEMVQRAQSVARMLDTLRAARQAEEAALSPNVSSRTSQKRSWDVANSETRSPPLRMVFETGQGERTDDQQLNKELALDPPESASNVDRARAEQDMELIKRKRHALHDPEPETPPAPRPKKRGPRVTASSPGQCNSCGNRDTPEWRRGPEGPRTLCNACGLHYAKVIREGGSFTTEAAVEQFNDIRSASASARRVSGAASSSETWTQTPGFYSNLPLPVPPVPPQSAQVETHHSYQQSAPVSNCSSRYIPSSPYRPASTLQLHSPRPPQK